VFVKTQASLDRTDTERSVLPGIPESAICVQRFDDSLNSAIRITYRISLRSSSLREPRYPLLRVVLKFRNIYRHSSKRASKNWFSTKEYKGLKVCKGANDGKVAAGRQTHVIQALGRAEARLHH
jgi:hypothetical protein